MSLQTLSNNKPPHDLFEHIRLLIDKARISVSVTVNTELIMLYWKIGYTIKDNVLQNKRAGYGEEIMTKLANKLAESMVRDGLNNNYFIVYAVRRLLRKSNYLRNA